MPTSTDFHESKQLGPPAPREHRQEPRSDPKSRGALTVRPRCAGTRNNGQPCGANPAANGYCIAHDPRFTEEDRQAWRRRGQLAQAKRQVSAELAAAFAPPDFASPGGVRKCLEETAQKVAQHALTPSQATAIGSLAALAIKLGELELETQLLDAELADAQADRTNRRVDVAV